MDSFTPIYPNPIAGGPPSSLSAESLQSFWDDLTFQLSDFNSVINIPGTVFRGLDEGAKYYIAQSMMCVPTISMTRVSL